MGPLRKVYDHQGCQICTTGLPDFQFSPYFITFLLNFASNRLRNMLFEAKPTFSRMTNPIEALRKVYDHQGCQICTTGLPDFQSSPYFIAFLHNFASKCHRNMIFQPNPIFLRARNLMEALRKVYDYQGCHSCTTGLPDCRFSPYFIPFA